MDLLGQKDGKFWWYHNSLDGILHPYTEEEMEALRQERIELRARVAAEIYSKYFKKGEDSPIDH